MILHLHWCRCCILSSIASDCGCPSSVLSPTRFCMLRRKQKDDCFCTRRRRRRPRVWKTTGLTAQPARGISSSLCWGRSSGTPAGLSSLPGPEVASRALLSYCSNASFHTFTLPMRSRDWIEGERVQVQRRYLSQFPLPHLRQTREKLNERRSRKTAASYPERHTVTNWIICKRGNPLLTWSIPFIFELLLLVVLIGSYNACIFQAFIDF